MVAESDNIDADDASGAPGAIAERRRMWRSTAIFALATFISRVAGMVRAIATAAIFGVGNQLSAYTIAFQIPNLFRSLVADSALSAAFVPVFTELRERDDDARAWRLATSIAALITIVLGPLCMLLMAGAPALVHMFVSESAFTPAEIDLTVRLTRILMPIVLLFALSGLVVGILNAHDHFSSPAFAPVAWNFVIILSLVLAGTMALTPDEQVVVYAIGTLAGTVVQLVIPLPWLRSVGRPPRGSLRVVLGDPRIREVLLLMLPVTIGLGLINLQQLIDAAISTHVPRRLIPEGVDPGAGPAALENAFRLYMLPQGIFSVGISTVFFPALARLAARADLDGFRETFADGLRQILLALLPASALLVALATPIVRLLYQHGAFTPAQTDLVAATLVALAIGLTFNGASLLLIRAFFSLKAPWLPTIVSMLTLAVNVVADLLLYRTAGIAGIALATSIVNVVSFAVLYVLLQRKVGLLGTVRTARVLGLAAVASAASAAIGLATCLLVERVLGTGMAGRLLGVGAAGCIAGVAYLTMIARMRLVRSGFVRELVRRR